MSMLIRTIFLFFGLFFFIVVEMDFPATQKVFGNYLLLLLLSHSLFHYYSYYL